MQLRERDEEEGEIESEIIEKDRIIRELEAQLSGLESRETVSYQTQSVVTKVRQSRTLDDEEDLDAIF